MNTLTFKREAVQHNWPLAKIKLIIILMVAWAFMPKIISIWFPEAGLIDPGAWQLALFAVTAFLGMLLLSWYLHQYGWHRLGFPSHISMVSQFENLTLWQQFVCYWASFALLLLAALLSLLAIF